MTVYDVLTVSTCPSRQGAFARRCPWVVMTGAGTGKRPIQVQTQSTLRLPSTYQAWLTRDLSFRVL